MTDEERAELRSNIEGMTIRDARFLAEKSTETLRVLADLGIHQSPPIVARAFSPDGFRAPTPSPDSPFPCAGCGRERPQSPREAVQARACDVCGNNLPARPGEGAVVTNKPAVVRNGAVTAIVAPLSAEERAAKLALPAFVNGEPVAE